MIGSASGATASKARNVGACRWSSWLWDTYTASTRLRSYRSGTGIGYGYHWSRYAGPLHHGSVSSVRLPCRTSRAACPMKSTRIMCHARAQLGPAGRSGADLRHARSKYLDVLETIFFEPAEHFVVGVPRLILRRIPIKGVQDAPAPIALEADERHRAQQPADSRQSPRVVQRRGGVTQ